MAAWNSRGRKIWKSLINLYKVGQRIWCKDDFLYEHPGVIDPNKTARFSLMTKERIETNGAGREQNAYVVVRSDAGAAAQLWLKNRYCIFECWFEDRQKCKSTRWKVTEGSTILDICWLNIVALIKYESAQVEPKAGYLSILDIYMCIQVDELKWPKSTTSSTRGGCHVHV